MKRDPLDQLLAEDNGNDGDSTTTKIKVGDKEYTPEEVAALEEKAETATKQYKELQSDYSKKAEKAKKYDELAQKSEDILSGDIPASNLTEKDIENLRYFKQMGIMTKAQVNELLTRNKEEIRKELEDERLAKQAESKKSKQIKSMKAELETLTADYDFVKQNDLVEYMKERNKKDGVILTPNDAARLLYPKEFALVGEKPRELPTMDSEIKDRRHEVAQSKIMGLRSREMNEMMRNKLGTLAVE
jgi:hypothetical protein